MLYKKVGIPERKYASHSAKDFTGVRTKRSIKDVMKGPIGSRTNYVQQYKKSEKKWKKDLKYLQKQNKMLYRISKKSGLRREIKKIKKIREKASKKTSISSSEDWDSESSLARDSSWDKYRRPDGCKDINKLDHTVTDNLKNYNDHGNEAINSDPAFDNSSFN